MAAAKLTILAGLRAFDICLTSPLTSPLPPISHTPPKLVRTRVVWTARFKFENPAVTPFEVGLLLLRVKGNGSV